MRLLKLHEIQTKDSGYSSYYTWELIRDLLLWKRVLISDGSTVQPGKGSLWHNTWPSYQRTTQDGRYFRPEFCITSGSLIVCQLLQEYWRSAKIRM